MKLYTVDSLKNKNYEELGLVKGSIVMSKHIGRDIMAAFKTIIGGEIKGYTEMINSARDIATSRMIDEATKLGADAIISIKYQTSSGSIQGSLELLAYGTAIKIR